MTNYGPRIRAARGWAKLSQEELAEALGREKQFVLRREYPPADERHQTSSKGDLIAIAAVCGVPLAFLEEGFGGTATSEVSERLAALEEAVREVQRELVVVELEAPSQTAPSDQPGDHAQDEPPP